ncbi:MAG: 4Fe-4S binding protein [Thermoleophilia bacterium]|nr:4Fe-4S binding protein [Thermoleophilia bacterium]
MAERPSIDREECTGCGICVDECPQECLELDSEDIAVLAQPESCDSCATCEESCPTEAITIEEQ